MRMYFDVFFCYGRILVQNYVIDWTFFITCIHCFSIYVILAVSGAHNTIVTARAGKDLMSSLASGLLTIVSHASFSYSYIFTSL